LPFEDSRRLTGDNLFFASTGAVLELAGVAADESLLASWRARVIRARQHLGWESGQVATRAWRAGSAAPASVARLHAGGASLAMTAPCDRLFTATEVNEWALCSALRECDPTHWAGLEGALVAAAVEAADGAAVSDPLVLDEAQALQRLRRLADLEARPALLRLLDAADARGLPYVLDETVLTLGAGAGGIGYPVDGLPAVDEVPWGNLRDIPTVVITGSNGKTTTVRLVAACARRQGWCAGYNCTDGVVVGDESVASGDYSGPAGARVVLRDQSVKAAVLETARGGILRRGIAVRRAHAAVVTNVSCDHFGEYGIYDLEGLADVKLSVASLLASGGLLVLNADDPLLRLKAGGLAQRFGYRPRLGWFALDADSPALRQHRAGGGMTCGVRDGRLWLARENVEYDLGSVAQMPLTVGGSAAYNVANLAAAALAAVSIGVAPEAISAVFSRFGSDPEDNKGRLMRFDAGGVTVLVDYAHNPEGIRGLLAVAAQLRRGDGRLGIQFGHAGNRQDSDLQHVAEAAAAFEPDLVAIAEHGDYLRGRQPGEVPRIIRAELLRQGLPPGAITVCASEIEAARQVLDWARPGDVLALMIHSAAARAATLDMLGAGLRRAESSTPD
jgi:UDP-N-acetylmuramyl tripeptide synthase